MKDALGEASDRLELVAADLLDYDSLVKAFEGCDYVIHVASPVFLKEPKDEELVLGPAVTGTENVINACFKNNVKRVVVTSSSLCIINWHKEEEEVDESSWREITPGMPLYDKSKVLAEK
jgi:nucleoside-diphosphate-sugar epimerase